MNVNDMSNNRIAAVDVTKGLLIIFVVLSHVTYDGQPLRNWLFAFHIPCFLVLSGFLFKPDKKKVLKRGTIWLLLYVLFSFFDILVVYIFNSKLLTQKTLIGGFLCKDNQLIFNSPKWFLLALLFVQLILTFLYSIEQKLGFGHKCIYIYMIICVSLSAFLNEKIIFCIELIPIVMFYFLLGYCIKQKNIYKKYIEGKNLLLNLCITIILFLLVFNISQVNGMVSIQNMQYGNYILFIINSLIGCVAVVELGYIFRQNKLLQFYGQNTFVIFLTHYYLVRGVYPVLFPAVYESVGGQILITIFTMLIYIPVIKIWKKILVFFKAFMLHRGGKSGQN